MSDPQPARPLATGPTPPVPEAVHPAPGAGAPLPGAELWASCLEGLEDVGSVEAGSWSDPAAPDGALLHPLPELGGRFQQTNLLGEGSSARVWRAWDSLLERWVALKVLKAEGSPVLREARAQAQVEHPNVCRIYEAGKGYIVMELVDGPTLAQAGPALDLPRKLDLVRELALGVHAAHARGLVHLDLKLGNVLLQRREDGTFRPVVGDFGMVRTGRRPGGPCPMGTPPYTSPEQLTGDPTLLSARSDVYALGVLLYVLLAGVMPFVATDLEGLLEAIRAGQRIPLAQRRPDLAEDLGRIVERCLARDPRDRYPSARALAEDLGRFLRHEPVEAMGGGWSYRLTQWGRRHRRLAWGVGLGALVLAAGGGLVLARVAYTAEQAEWDTHFVKRVETLRRHLDRTYRLPPHTIDLDLAEARAMRDGIRQEMARQGRAAQAPGHLALGQARYLLDPEDPEALEAFRTAWRLGLHTELARNWLSLALLQEYRKAVAAAGAHPDAAKAATLRAEARARFLEPARAMLVGRGSEDQTRLQHLLEVAQVDAGDRATLLRLARAYRARFPHELDALLEEADVLVAVARDEAKREARTPDARPTGGAPTPWAEAEALLQAALRIAPSHPQVYRRLAEGVLEQEALPGQTPAARRALLAQSRRWLDGGLAVSPADPELWRLRIRHQVRALNLRLALGEAPGAEVRELTARFTDAVAHPDRAILRMVAPWQPLALRAAGAYDLRLPFDLAGLFATVGAEDLPDAYWWLVNAQFQMETGQDARFALGMAVRQAGIRPIPWQAGFKLALTRAEWARLQGEDAAPSLAEAEAILQRRTPATAPELPSETDLRREQALALGTASAWSALAAVLARQEPAMLETPHSLTACLAYLRGRLAVGRHDLQAGRDPRPALAGLVPWLQARLDRGRTTGRAELEAGLAELELLLGRASRSGRTAAYEAGLRACARALATYGPPTRDARRGGTPHKATGGVQGPFLSARIWVLRGELLLALAEQEPGGGRTLAAQARAAFREAVERNLHLARAVAPLVARAQMRANGGGRP